MIFKDANGTPIDELMGNGFKTDTKEVSLGEHDKLIGFYGKVSSQGSALLSLGLIVYDTTECDLD